MRRMMTRWWRKTIKLVRGQIMMIIRKTRYVKLIKEVEKNHGKMTEKNNKAGAKADYDDNKKEKKDDEMKEKCTN